MTTPSNSTQGAGPHSGQPVFTAGAPLEQARAAMIMIHGRGASARDILTLADEFPLEGFCFIAPQAAQNTWYPYPFMSPIERNEPWLSSALQIVGETMGRVEEAGIAADRIILLGFSQGACLATEFAARNAQRYGGIVGLSGGLIGPDGTPRHYPGSLDGTPVFLGCSDIDPHIPRERVALTAEVFGRLDGAVMERIYPGMGHTVNQDEINSVLTIMRSVLGQD